MKSLPRVIVVLVYCTNTYGHYQVDTIFAAARRSVLCEDSLVKWKVFTPVQRNTVYD